jgi:hypothetical protein
VRSRSARVWEAKMTGEPPGTLPRTPTSGAAALSPWSVKREADVATNDDRSALSAKTGRHVTIIGREIVCAEAEAIDEGGAALSPPAGSWPRVFPGL